MSAFLPRLDVDHAPGGANLRIPEDYNPLTAYHPLKFVYKAKVEYDSESENCCSEGVEKGGFCLYFQGVVIE